MVQFTDKESDKDGAFNSATISSGCLKPCQQVVSVVLALTGFAGLSQGASDYFVLRHISYGSERPTVGVTATRMNSVP